MKEKLTNEEIADLISKKVYYQSLNEADFAVQLFVEKMVCPPDCYSYDDDEMKGWILKKLSKIFTTEDSVDIYPGDKYFTVKVREYPTPKGLKEAPMWSIAGPYVNPNAHEQTGDIKYFSTREAAEKYVSENG